MLQLRSPRIIMQRVAERETASQVSSPTACLLLVVLINSKSRDFSGQRDPGETEKPRRGSFWQ